MISVIVPVYNVESYLKKCIESILNQTETNLEIILVDDGSTDHSGEICDEYAKKDERVQVYHKPNGGLMSAWKYGVCRCSGDYIGFVDSDDYIDSDMYEHLLAYARKYQSDLTICGLVPEYEDHTERENIFPEKEFYDRAAIEKEIYPRLFNQGILNRYISPNRVTKLFRRQLLMPNLDFCNEEISLGEDLVTTFSCLCDAGSITVCKDFAPYHYKIRGTSIMGKFNPNFYKQTVLLTKTLRHISEEKHVFDFSDQLTHDFLCLSYYGIELNAEKACATRSDMVAYIKMTLEDPFFQFELKKGNLQKINKKSRIYKILGNLHAYNFMYWFIKKIVLPKRKQRNYSNN